jgi:hypothetical protein
VLRKKKASILNGNHVELLSVTIDMHTKMKFLLVFLFIVTTLGLLSAVVPVQGIDADISSDSLVTEELLVAPIVSTFMALPYQNPEYIAILPRQLKTEIPNKYPTGVPNLNLTNQRTCCLTLL